MSSQDNSSYKTEAAGKYEDFRVAGMETAETIKEKKLVYQIPEKMHQKEADEKVEKATEVRENKVHYNAEASPSDDQSLVEKAQEKLHQGYDAVAEAFGKNEEKTKYQSNMFQKVD